MTINRYRYFYDYAFSIFEEHPRAFIDEMGELDHASSTIKIYLSCINDVARAMDTAGMAACDLDETRAIELVQGQRRLEMTLRALDGWISGASQKEIAISLFGIARVEADWGRGHDHLKSQVRRLIKRGRWLMDGGYRTLLR